MKKEIIFLIVNIFFNILHAEQLTFTDNDSNTTIHKSFPNKVKAEDISLALDPNGHTGAILSLIVSSSDEIVTASKDKTIRVWNLTNGLEKRKILGQIGLGSDGTIGAIALSPNKNYLVVGGNLSSAEKKYSVIRVYDYQSGKLLKLLKSHVDIIHDVKFSDDNKYLISSSQDKTVKVWNVEKDFELVDTVLLPQPAVQAQMITKNDSNHLIILDATGLLALYSLQQMSIIDGHKGSGRVSYTRSLVISKHDIAISDKDNIYIFDINTLNFKGRIRESGTPKLAYSPDGRFLVAGTNKIPYICRVYDATNEYQLVSKFDTHDSEVTSLKFLDNNHVISIGGNKNTIYIWNIHDTSVVKTIEGTGSTITSTSIQNKKISFGTRFYTYSEKSNDEKQKIRNEMMSLLKKFMKNNTISNYQFSDLEIDNLLEHINYDQYAVYLDHLSQNYNDFGALERTINLTSFNIVSNGLNKRILNTTYQGFSLIPVENTAHRYFKLLYNSDKGPYPTLNINKKGSKVGEIKTDNEHDINAFGFYKDFILTADDSGYIYIFII